MDQVKIFFKNRLPTMYFLFLLSIWKSETFFLGRIDKSLSSSSLLWMELADSGHFYASQPTATVCITCLIL